MFAKFIGISPETAALIEERRQSPTQSEDDILKAALLPGRPTSTAATKIGCDLGKGALLADQERLYLFRYKSSKDAGEPEAVAVASGGKLMLFERPVRKSRGSLVTPALRLVQERLNDRSDNGTLTSLDAWNYWYVHRNGRYVPAGELRDQSKIVRRGRTRLPPLKLNLEALGP